MSLTNANSDFATWFKQLEMLAKKIGYDIYEYEYAREYWKCLYYDRGMTADAALAKDLE